MTGLPMQMPRDGMSAYAYFLTVKQPTIEDLKGMMFLEASGQGLYDGLAALTDKDVQGGDKTSHWSAGVVLSVAA